MTRRKYLASLGGGVGSAAAFPAQPALSQESQLIVEAVKAALEKNLRAALLERAYPGQFTITADAGKYGESTWAGLDSWQMAGAYVLAGKRRVVQDYFDFVQASQRKDGNIPFVIYSAENPPANTKTYLRGLRYPQDVYSYQPVVRPGQSGHSDMSTRKWIGMFTHWQMKANPFGTLAAVCYILTASEIFAATKSESWLAGKFPSLELTGRYLLSRIGQNGLAGGAAFYIESIPRDQWDGISQCYTVYALRELAAMGKRLGNSEADVFWSGQADKLATRFREVFWQRDHFAEYVHHERGLVDIHGLSDVNWAAIGLGVATAAQAKTLWPILMREKAFWHGGMPTQIVTKPGAYQPWEYPEPLPFPYSNYMFDIAAMGRVWYLEVLACMRMHDHRRLREGVVKVCEMGQKHGWYWHERYRAAENNTVKPDGGFKYCEYPAILVRAVLGNPEVFPEAKGLRL